MAVDLTGLAAIIVFYTLIFCVGLWAAWRRKSKARDMEEVMLAGRDIGPFVGLLTLTATWVGGGYINGSAEAVYKNGLVWCQAPFGYAISLTLGGLFFAKKMRDAGYVTMLDPLQIRFGSRWGSFLFFPALAGEVLWSASILAALGTTLAVMLNIDEKISILLSAAIAVSYTLFGGLAAVAYTDVVQLFCIFIGLWAIIPYALTHEAVGSLSKSDWLGSIPAGSYKWGYWSDSYILLIFGGIPWQVYFQRVLSARTSRQAQLLSIAASLGCMIMVIPACLIGAIAKVTDWEATGYANETFYNKTEGFNSALVLPLVMKYLTPPWASFLGLGAVSAAVMSSADSSVLSSASMFSRNLYKNVIRIKAGQTEQLIVMRISIVAVASLSCYIAIAVGSVYDLFHLCGDLVYVMLFPQLTAAVHFPNYVNTYGSILAYVIGFTFRILGGEKLLGIPAVIKFPWYDEVEGKQNFPFRTIAMLITMVILFSASILIKWLFTSGIVSRKWDFLNVTKNTLEISSKHKRGVDNMAMDHMSEKVEARKQSAY